MGVENGSYMVICTHWNGPPEHHHALGSERDLALNSDCDAIDVSSKDGREQRVMPGRGKFPLTFSALYVPDDTAYQELLAACRGGTKLTLVWYYGGGYDGTPMDFFDCVVTHLGTKAPDQDAATVEATIEVNGGPVT